jgi:4-nitrophenyl phosphatase
MYEVCLERFQMRPSEVLVVGDRLETDIAGAQAIGCRTAVVLSGVSTPEQVATWQPQPNWVTADLTALVDGLEEFIGQQVDG